MEKRRKVKAMRKLVTFLSVGAIAVSSLSGTLTAQAYTNNQVKNTAERYSELEKAASFDTSKVSVNRITHSFEQKTVYTTFDKEKDPKEILDEPVLINDIPFIVSNTETPTLISQETVEPLVKTIVTDTFLGEETDESNQPFPSISEDGVKYNLTSKTLIEGAVKDRKEHKSTEVTYTSVEDKVKVPEKTVIEMSDKASGKEFEATLDLVKEEVLKEYWDNDFEFPITVSGYGDANVFNLNGIEIPADTELIKYKDEFLKMLDLSTKAYEIESIKWDGEAYMVNGNTMRNAVAKGRKYVKDIKAIYEADVPLPAMPEKSWRCTYTEEFPEGNTLYTMVTNATYTVDPTVAKSRGGLLGVLDSVVGTITAAYSAVIESFTERPIATTIPLVLVAGLISIFVTRRMKEKKILAENTAGNI